MFSSMPQFSSLSLTKWRKNEILWMQQSTPQLLAWVKETQTGAYLALQDLVSGLSIRCEKLNKNSSLRSVCKYYK